ncbi:MAG: phosphate transport system regulatory protein PhoU, partial [Myxococcales bacterium]|nr:phosphate transport system regulatory protein PhoU [Myxococcales bacterium]
AIDAFVNESAAAAEAVLLQDNSVDALYDRVFGDILEMMQSDAAAVHRGIHMQSVAKWLERMADHSENLAEQVIFMLEGKDVRHPGRLAGR